CGGRYARIAQGDTTEKPMPTPNARRTRVRAAAATAPAAIAAHDTAGLSATGVEISTDSKTINAPSDDCPFPFWLRTGLLVGRTRSHSQRLYVMYETVQPLLMLWTAPPPAREC